MPRRSARSKIEVDLDGADLEWLRDRGYPFGVDAAGYLRMMVRQARLEPTFKVHFGPAATPPTPRLPQYSANTRDVDAATGVDIDPGHPGGVVDVERFAASVVGAAEDGGLIVAPQAGDESPGGEVVLIGERRQRSPKEWASG